MILFTQIPFTFWLSLTGAVSQGKEKKEDGFVVSEQMACERPIK